MKQRWQTRSVGDLCQVIGGGTPSKHREAYYSGEIPWATVRDMRSEVITETEFRITKTAVASSATHIIPAGNVVIATRVGLGKVCLLGQDTAINQDLRGLVPINPEALSVRFLFWWLRSVADSIVAAGTGATVQGVKLPFVKSLQVPLPPVSEQERIVGILDEAFEAIATARANTEQNLGSAREVFTAHLNAVFARRGDGWESKDLGAVAMINYGYTESASTEPVGPRFLRITDIKDNSVDWSSVPYCEIQAGDVRKYGLADGDIVFARTGATTGKSFLVKDPPVSVFASYLIRVRLRGADLLPDFVHLFFQSDVYWRAVEQGVTGSAQGGFNASKLATLSIPFPPLEDQHRLVAAFTQLFGETRRLERIGDRKLAALDALKQSLLYQAFTGSL